MDKLRRVLNGQEDDGGESGLVTSVSMLAAVSHIILCSVSRLFEKVVNFQHFYCVFLFKSV